MLKYLQIVIIILFFSSYILNSKTYELSLDQNYSQDVWFDFEQGVVKSESKDNWDLAFQVTANAGVRINGQKGMNMWVVPDSDEDSWNDAIDTNGMASEWESFINSEDKWNVGAFNLGLDGFESGGDFGWGIYDPQVTHFTTGNKVFIIKLADGSYKKFFIEILANGVYEFKLADIDGSNEVTTSLNKKDFTGQLYGYYNIESNESFSREPVMENWDLVFGKYMTLIEMQPGTYMRYGVTGVRTGPDIMTAILNEVDPASEQMPEIASGLYNYGITRIGSDWKKFDLENSTYNVVEDRVYFLTARSSENPDAPIYRLYFTGFEGGSTGNITFEFGDAVTSVIESNDNVLGSFSIYPNIINSQEPVNLVLNTFGANSLNIKIYDMLGNLVHSSKTNSNGSLETYSINNIDLSSGMYMVTIESNGAVGTQKLIVR